MFLIGIAIFFYLVMNSDPSKYDVVWVYLELHEETRAIKREHNTATQHHYLEGKTNEKTILSQLMYEASSCYNTNINTKTK